MAWNQRFWRFCTKCAEKNFAKTHLNNLKQLTLTGMITNPLYRLLFMKFSQNGQELADTEAVKLLKRYSICEKILRNPDIIDDPLIYEALINLSPSLSWELRITELSVPSERSLNFVPMMENLKWETILDLVCHSDYVDFLIAIDNNSKKIKKYLRELSHLVQHL